MVLQTSHQVSWLRMNMWQQLPWLFYYFLGESLSQHDTDLSMKDPLSLHMMNRMNLYQHEKLYQSLLARLVVKSIEFRLE